MRRTTKLSIMALGLLFGVLALTGCPSGAVQQAAQASANAAIALKSAQQGEIAAFKSGYIPAADHQFVEQQFLTIGELGQTTDSCIKSASNNNGAITCLNSALTQLNTINSQGGTYLKSAPAKSYFSLAVSAVESVLASIDTTLGGTPPAITPLPAQ